MLLVNFLTHGRTRTQVSIGGGIRMIRSSNRVMSVASSDQEEAHRREKEVFLLFLSLRRHLFFILFLANGV